MKYSKRLSNFIILTGIFSPGVNAASNIDTTNRYAWGINSGWLDFNDTNGGVTVYNDHLEGYAWAENIGWIRLGSHTGGGTHTYTNTSSTDYGVNHDGAGNLSGYAWSHHVGWIKFQSSENQVTIDLATGDFDGYAWAENVGWIHFKNDTPNTHQVRLLLSVDLSVSANTGTEADTTAITVTATTFVAVTGGDKTVELAVSGVDSSDYTLSGTTITIPDNQTTGNVTFTITDDDAVEGDETATLTISNPSTGLLLGTTTQNITITDNEAPKAPINLTATATSQTQIDLSWTDNSNNETGFKIEQPAGTLLNTTGVGATSYSHTGLTCGTNYNYAVKATNAGGDSTAVTASATTAACPSTGGSSGGTTATPLPSTMTLFINFEGLGFGKVTSSPSGINCQTVDEECKASFKTGTTVKLTATEDTGSEFSSWGGHSDCADGQVFLTQSRTCKPYFKLGPRTLTIVPADQGTVSSQPEGISCGLNNPACAFTFDGGSKITLAATPNAGWLFDGWEGEGCENVLTLTQNLSCQPRFSPAPATPEDLQLTQPDGAVITEITPSHTTVGQPVTQTIVLTNNCSTEMVLSDLTLPPGFQLTSPLPEKIAVGDSVPLQVQLIAETEGVLQGNLSFNVNGQPVSYPLTGTVTTETVTCAEATRLYVNQTAVGNQTGCNWLDAIPQLQMALTAIREGKFPAVKEIWIAKGTYKPTEDLNREASFALIDNLAIY